jgi:hypothetical protein
MLPRMRSAAVLVVLALGCQSGASSPGAGPDQTLAKDLDAICNAVERSGAAGLEPADQAYTMAQWLPQNVSEAGRQWLVRFSRLGEDRGARHRMLERDARAAGVLDCPLLALW